MAKATAVRNIRDDHQKAFLKIFNSLCGRFNRWQVWQDFVMVTAIEISNATDKQNAPERTKTYQTIISKYSDTTMSELSKSLGNMEYDGLIADINPKLVVSGGTLRKLGAAGTIKRGTILAKSGGTAGDNKLVALGTAASGDTETLTAYAILCDDVDVGTTDDVTVPVYLAGCFNLNKCITINDHTITEAEKDALRNGGIFFKAAAPAL